MSDVGDAVDVTFDGADHAGTRTILARAGRRRTQAGHRATGAGTHAGAAGRARVCGHGCAAPHGRAHDSGHWRCGGRTDARAQGHASGEGGRGHDPRARRRSSANRTIPAVVFTDPEIAWAGLTEDQAKPLNRAVPRRGVSLGGQRPSALAGSPRRAHQVARRSGDRRAAGLRDRGLRSRRADWRGGGGDRPSDAPSTTWASPSIRTRRSAKRS